jgi:hypothetical protein
VPLAPLEDWKSNVERLAWVLLLLAGDGDEPPKSNASPVGGIFEN